jgi:hypothetical protein
MKKITYCALITFCIAFIVACGGGGGGGSSSSGGSSGTVVSTNAFPLSSGYTTLVATGQTVRFNSSGTCSGTFSNISAPANVSTTFEGQPALSGASVISFSFTNCTPSSSVSTETRYYDTNYIPKGYSVLGGNYGVYIGTPSVPTTVHVGDVGVVGSMNLYTSSSKATSAGRTDVSYAIEADTATTAIANIITKTYNTSNVLTVTEQDRYRMQANGALTAISYDVLYSSGTHLILQ